MAQKASLLKEKLAEMEKLRPVAAEIARLHQDISNLDVAIAGLKSDLEESGMDKTLEEIQSELSSVQLQR